MNPKPSVGLGWFVKLNDHKGPAAGSFGHNGARGPVICVDPTHQVVMILPVERMDAQTNEVRAALFKGAVEKYGKPANR